VRLRGVLDAAQTVGTARPFPGYVYPERFAVIRFDLAGLWIFRDAALRRRILFSEKGLAFPAGVV